MYYSKEDVKHLLDSLRNSYETEVVEYKEAKSSFGDKDLGKYLSALSNEALLAGKADAWLFFGSSPSTTAIATPSRGWTPSRS